MRPLLDENHIEFFKVGDYSLKIHKSAHHLSSVFISKRRFSSLQTRKSFGEILSGNYRFLRRGIRIDNKLHVLTYCLSTTRLLITDNRLALLLPIGSDYVRNR